MVEGKLFERIQEDLKIALKDRDKDRASVLRMLISSLKNAQIENRGELSAEQEIQVVSSYAKKLKDSIEQFEIVMGYLPKQLSEEEITEEVQKVISELGAESPKDIGRVMQEMMKRFRGRVDGRVVNRIVSEMLRK